MHPNLIPHDRVLAYLLAGKATFTIRGREHRFTFKIKQPKFEGVPAVNLRYVSVLTGPDNTTAYGYLGNLVRVRGQWEFRNSHKSSIGAEAKSAVAIKWVLRRLIDGLDLTKDVEVWHDGRCGCCRRPLTVPASIQTGLGAKCAERLHQ